MDTYSLREMGGERERENAHRHVDGCRGQKRAPDALGLDLQVVVSSLT